MRNRSTHYDAFPFQFIDSHDVSALAGSHPPLLRRVVDALPDGALVADVGSGPGRLAVWAAARGLAVVALDRSLGSLAMMSPGEGAPMRVAGDALSLPLRPAWADLVVLDGVAHHTTDPLGVVAGGAGLARPGGRVYVAVYKRWRYYPLLYHTVGAVARRCSRRPGCGWITEVIFRVYSLVHQIVRGRRKPAALRNLFADYLLTPRASFHSKAEVLGWGQRLGLRLCEYDRHGSGNCHLFVFEAPAPLAAVRS